jgi:hypothetical protein
MRALIDYTNTRLKGWYYNALLDYGVRGEGKARIEGDKFIIDFVENGEAKIWSCFFSAEYLYTQEIDYFFNVWMEEAK